MLSPVDALRAAQFAQAQADLQAAKMRQEGQRKILDRLPVVEIPQHLRKSEPDSVDVFRTFEEIDMAISDVAMRQRIDVMYSRRSIDEAYRALATDVMDECIAAHLLPIAEIYTFGEEVPPELVATHRQFLEDFPLRGDAGRTFFAGGPFEQVCVDAVANHVDAAFANRTLPDRNRGPLTVRESDAGRNWRERELANVAHDRLTTFRRSQSFQLLVALVKNADHASPATLAAQARDVIVDLAQLQMDDEHKAGLDGALLAANASDARAHFDKQLLRRCRGGLLDAWRIALEDNDADYPTLVDRAREVTAVAGGAEVGYLRDACEKLRDKGAVKPGPSLGLTR